MPSANRQNNVDLISSFITETKNDIRLEEIEDIRLIQISFDGNNNTNPPDVMNDEIFNCVKKEVRLNIASYINIIYTDVYKFEDCKINDKAIEKLRSILYIKKKKWF